MASQPISSADAGTISLILDLIGDTLTPAQRTAIAAELTALRPEGVHPGDLITAELFNDMRGDINDLLTRMAALEGTSGGPFIERIEPEGTDKAINTQLIIVGRNLKPDNLDTKVTIGDIVVTDFFLDPDKKRLVLPVPVGFTTLPVTVPVKVTTGGKTSNSVSIRVVAAQVVPTGSIQITRTADPIGAITTGGTNNITFKIKSQLNVTRDFQLSAQVLNFQGSTAQAWLAEVQFSEASPIRLASGEERTVTLKVKVPTDATSADLRLHAVTSDDAFSGNSPVIPLVVGATPAVSDTRAEVSQRVFDDPDEDLVFENIPINGNNVAGFKLRPSKSTILPMQLTAKSDGAGFYRFEIDVQGETNRWKFQTPAAASIEITQNQNQLIDIPISSTNKSDSTTVSFLTITAKCFANSTAPTPRFTSFKRIPIVGKN
jgi:hypothetical protein